MNVMIKTVDMFTQMTDKQIAMFSRKLAELPELSHLPLVKLVEVTKPLPNW